ncbi:MAG: collagen-like protein [Eggerthellaceae bacterium]|nr:collagen-like protein [Eggerthellaceae bacterium]
MLDGYGLHHLTWDTCDERFGDVLVASPADAQGRGISLAVRQNGAAANLAGATLYLVWRHKVTGERGTEPFTAIDASAGTFSVFYPAAMQEAEGAVQAQVMVSRGDDTYISSRVFTIRVEPVIVGGEEHQDGFTLFLEAINAYEHATEITTDAADAANAAASAANSAASNATTVAEGIQAAAQRGDYDGEDGFSPTAIVTQTVDGATITITDKNGTTTTDIAKGAKGDKGDTGATGPKGDKGDTGEQGPQGIQGETDPKGDKGDTGATGAQGPKGDTGDTGVAGAQGPKGDKGDTGEAGAAGPQGPKGDTGDTGPKGETGAAGADGSDGISCTHSWNGTVLSVTSASGTSSADLVGPQGPTGATGATGPAGADGTTFAPQSPLALSSGVLSVDLSGYAETSDLPPKLWYGMFVPDPEEGALATHTYMMVPYEGLKVGDYFLSTMSDRMGVVESMGGEAGAWTVGVRGVLDMAKIRGILPTTDLDLAAGVSGSAQVDVRDHALSAGALLLNTTSGNLMQVTSDVDAATTLGVKVTVAAVGLGNVFGPDLTGYATQSWVTQQINAAIAALDDLSEESF